MRRVSMIKTLLGFIPLGVMVLALGACSGGGGGGDSGTGGGFLVTERNTGNYEIAVYRADAVGLGPVTTIPNGRLYADWFGNPRMGIAFGVPGVAKYAAMGVFVTSTPLILGMQAGHGYDFIDLIPTATPRFAWADCASPGTPASMNCSVMTSLTDGTGVRTIKTGCDDVVVPTSRVASHGIAFNCKVGGANQWWYSDGVASAFQLAPPSVPDVRLLEALMATRAIFYDPDRKHLTSQPLMPAEIEVNLWESDSMTRDHSILRVAAKRDSYNGKLIVRVTNTDVTGPAKYEVNTMLEDGTDFDLEITSAGVPILFDVAPDESTFLTLLIDKDAAGTNDEAWTFELTGQNGVSFTEGNAATMGDNALDMRYAPDGTVVINHSADGWHFFSPTGARRTDLLAQSLYAWVGAKGSFVYLNLPTGASNYFIAAKPADGSLYDIVLDATLPYPVLRDDGALLYVDDQQQAWSAIFNPATNLFESSLIDSVATVQIHYVGDGPGSRTYLLMDRAPAAGSDQLVVYDRANRSSPAQPLLSDVVSACFFAN